MTRVGPAGRSAVLDSSHVNNISGLCCLFTSPYGILPVLEEGPLL